MINKLDIKKRKISEFFVVFSSSFLYMIFAFWSTEIFTKTQKYFLWFIAIIILFFSYLFNNKGKIIIFTENFRFQISIVFFFVFSLFSVFWAFDSTLAFTRLKVLIFVLIPVFFISFMFRKESDINLLLQSIEYGGNFASLYLIYLNGIRNMFSSFQSGRRLSYTGVNSNTIGIIAAFSVVICVYFLKVEGFKISSLLSIPSVIIVLFSVSKKAFLIVLIGIFLFFLLNSLDRKSLFNTSVKVFGIIAICIVLYNFILQLPIFARLQIRINYMVSGFISGTNSDNTDISTSIRLELLQIGTQIIKQHPIIGVGLDNARLFNSEYTYLHNNFLEIFADLGIIGLIIYYFPWVSFLIRFVKLHDFRDTEFVICFSLLLVFVVMDFGRVSYYNVGTYYFCLLFCLESQIILKNTLKN